MTARKTTATRKAPVPPVTVADFVISDEPMPQDARAGRVPNMWDKLVERLLEAGPGSDAKLVSKVAQVPLTSFAVQREAVRLAARRVGLSAVCREFEGVLWVGLAVRRARGTRIGGASK